MALGHTKLQRNAFMATIIAVSLIYMFVKCLLPNAANSGVIVRRAENEMKMKETPNFSLKTNINLERYLAEYGEVFDENSSDEQKSVLTSILIRDFLYPVAPREVTRILHRPNGPHFGEDGQVSKITF